MIAKDLRIGNIVHDFTGNIRPVISQDIANFESGADRFIPVDLTPGILGDIGFKPDPINADVYQIKIDIPGQTGEFKFSGVPKSIGFLSNGLYGSGPLKYVHELQNLYHSLTGKELDISGVG